MPAQKGGGSVGQSLKYVDPAAPEQSAAAGGDLLKQQGLVVRPSIGGGTRKRKGGFIPSVMSGVVNAGVYLAPLTAITARRLFSRKQRRGGGKKGNLFKAQKEEAKAELDVIGKASAANVLAFVAAKRRGSEAAEEYLTQFRRRKQEKNEANTAKRRAKEEAKAAKAAEREAKRASKKASKKEKKAAAAPKPPSAASSASTASTSASRSRSRSASSNRPVTKAQLAREAAENMARAKAEAEAAKAAAKKPLKNSQVAWFSLVENAAKRLAGNGVPTRKNAMRYASLLKQGKNAEASAFLANFRARSRKSNKKPAAAKASAAAVKVSEAAVGPSPYAAAGNNGAPSAKPKKPASKKAAATETKKRKSPSAASKRYFEKLKEARIALEQVGHPTGPNMAKFASMSLKGENTTEFLRNFASRRPKSLATAKAPKKAKAAAAKALTAVKEANENNNNANSMQGYSENFEPESENE